MPTGLFPTFFLSGFECSTFRWKDQGRRDLAAETQHRRHLREDYELLRELGIGAVREGVAWPFADAGGSYDLSWLDAAQEAAAAVGVTPIWDLCHYGYPDDLDPFDAAFAPRFASYCRAVAEHLGKRAGAAPWFTPMNEITFFSYAGGEWGWAAPHGRDRATRDRLLLALCQATLAGVEAIREVLPDARMLHVDPLVKVVAPRDRPDLEEAARHEDDEGTFLAWDVLAGRRHPELGGHPEALDVVGVNCYSFGQMEYREQGPHAALPPGDDRIVPLCDLLVETWERYRHPMVIAETSGLEHGRPDWLDDVVSESLAALTRGVDLQGVCLFPLVDMPDWHTGEWLHNGLVDLVPEADDLRRAPYDPYVERLRTWQRRLDQTEALSDDAGSRHVDLDDVVAAAQRLQAQPDEDWR